MHQICGKFPAGHQHQYEHKLIMGHLLYYSIALIPQNTRIHLQHCHLCIIYLDSSQVFLDYLTTKMCTQYLEIT